jgi:sugar phosphate permease
MNLSFMTSEKKEETASHPIELNPSSRSVKGLNALLLCISDVRNGVGPLLSIHLRNALHWNPAKIGMPLATVEFSAFLSQIPAGLLADASTRKRAIIATACCLIILGSLIILFFATLSTILIAQLLIGISIALISPALGSITLGLLGRNKLPSRVGKNEVWNHCGNVFSALIAGLTGYFFGSHWIFIYSTRRDSLCSCPRTAQRNGKRPACSPIQSIQKKRHYRFQFFFDFILHGKWCSNVSCGANFSK